MNLFTKNISVSQLGTLIRDWGSWQNQYLFNEYENTMPQSAAIWSLAHRFCENLLRSWWDETYATNTTYDCIWDYNWETYIINPDRLEKPLNQSTELEILQNFWTKLVDFGKSWSKEALLKWLKWAIEWYLSEKINYWNVEWVEISMTHDITEQILDYKFESPVPFKAISDVVCRLTEDRQIITADKEVLTIPAWSLYVEDYKFKEKYSDMNFDNPQYFFQAMFNFYCLQKEFGEAPAFMNFREIKTTKNRDWSSQHQVITFLFSWEDFEVNKTFFWRYLMWAFKYIEFLQESDVIYNVFDFISWTKNWKKQLAFYQSVEVGQLKTKMSVSNRSKVSWNNISWHNFNLLDKGQKLEKWEIAEIITIEDKVRSKLREFWIDVKFVKTIEWYAFNQMLFELWRWVKINDIKNKEQELSIATKTENIRVVWVVWWTWYLWIEVPRKERIFLDLKEYKKKVRWLKVPVWKTLNGETIEINLTDSNFPHLLISWTTWSWKTEMLRVVIESLKWKANLIIVDPKTTEFDEDDWEYITDEEDVFIMLQREYFDIKMRNNTIKAFSKAKWDKTINDIESYNQKVSKKDKLYHKVIIIDEVADLRLSDFWKEIEKLLEKISNIWRSAWIHLVLASQRFDTKTLSWRLKNNITTRIALKTWSSVDSRVMIDVDWAEKLLGKWDMLFKNWADIQRLQGYYIA